MKERIHVGLIGSGFISEIHARSLRECPGAVLQAVASPSGDHARDFAARFEIPQFFTDYTDLLAMDDLDLVVIGAPNDLHCEMTCAAAAADKHVVRNARYRLFL